MEIESGILEYGGKKVDCQFIYGYKLEFFFKNMINEVIEEAILKTQKYTFFLKKCKPKCCFPDEVTSFITDDFLFITNIKEEITENKSKFNLVKFNVSSLSTFFDYSEFGEKKHQEKVILENDDLKIKVLRNEYVVFKKITNTVINSNEYEVIIDNNIEFVFKDELSIKEILNIYSKFLDIHFLFYKKLFTTNSMQLDDSFSSTRYHEINGKYVKNYDECNAMLADLQLDSEDDFANIFFKHYLSEIKHINELIEVTFLSLENEASPNIWFVELEIIKRVSAIEKMFKKSTVIPKMYMFLEELQNHEDESNKSLIERTILSFNEVYKPSNIKYCKYSSSNMTTCQRILDLILASHLGFFIDYNLGFLEVGHSFSNVNFNNDGVILKVAKHIADSRNHIAHSNTNSDKYMQYVCLYVLRNMHEILFIADSEIQCKYKNDYLYFLPSINIDLNLFI